MEGRGALIAALVIIILVLGVVAGTIFYLTKAFNIHINPLSGFLVNRQAPIPKLSPRPSLTPTVQPKASPQYTPQQTYNGQGFQVTFPKNWGLLTCTTSANFELDPYSSERLIVPCDVAAKSITFLVDKVSSCQSGEIIKLGSHNVIKTKTQYEDWLTYQWCINESGKVLDITHRVASSGVRGTSTQDYSAQVEQIMATLKIQ